MTAPSVSKITPVRAGHRELRASVRALVAQAIGPEAAARVRYDGARGLIELCHGLADICAGKPFGATKFSNLAAASAALAVRIDGVAGEGTAKEIFAWHPPGFHMRTTLQACETLALAVTEKRGTATASAPAKPAAPAPALVKPAAVMPAAVMPRAEFETLSVPAKAAFFRKGGRLTD